MGSVNSTAAPKASETLAGSPWCQANTDRKTPGKTRRSRCPTTKAVTHLSRIRAGRCGEISFSLDETAGDQGRKAERRWRGWTQPRLCGKSCIRSPRLHGTQPWAEGLAPASRGPRQVPHGTLLEELAKVRSQLDCLSFSEDAGDWEEASSVLGLMEAGASEETCGQHGRPCWYLWACAGSPHPPA